MRFGILGLLVALAVAPAMASARPLLSVSDGAVLDRVLSSNPAVRMALGPAIDVLRVEPVMRSPAQFVIDVASPDHEKGLRLIADVRLRSIVSVTPLRRTDIPYTASDVETAFAIAQPLRSTQAMLGAHLGDYRVAAPGQPSKPPYRVGGLVVRGTSAGDPCATHRCLQLVFHAPSGFIAGPPLLVDLTTGNVIGVPSSNTIAPIRRQKTRYRENPRPNPHTVAQSAAGTNVDCRKFAFSSVPSSWNVCWYWVPGPGLVLGPVSFSASGDSSPLQVIDNARVDQIFVPYASGYPRFYDTDENYPALVIPASVCKPANRVDGGTVCVQRQDRGVDWLYAGSQQPSGREGEQFVLWSVLDADNYEYIERWIFHDDGTLAGEVEATGENLPGDEHESHTHDYFWRIVPHIGGAGNSVDHTWLYEPLNGPTGTDEDQQLLTPAAIAWDPQTFDELSVYAPGVVNGRGDQISYRLIPQPEGGLARHEELFTRDDLWATSGNPAELDAFDLPLYVGEKVSLVDTAITLWYRGSFHHQPRDEDGYYDQHGVWIGATHAAPVGFVLQPRNLFDHSPFFGPGQP